MTLIMTMPLVWVPLISTEVRLARSADGRVNRVTLALVEFRLLVLLALVLVLLLLPEADASKTAMPLFRESLPVAESEQSSLLVASSCVRREARLRLLLLMPAEPLRFGALAWPNVGVPVSWPPTARPPQAS